MAKSAVMNGTLWRIIIGLAVIIATLIVFIQDMRPDVKANTEHRIKFEEKVSTMETNIALILEEVRK